VNVADIGTHHSYKLHAHGLHLGMIANPWFAHWNHRVLEMLFRIIPHTQNSDDRFGDLIANPFWSTWIFAAVFYRLWAIDDDRQLLRRTRLFAILTAIAVTFLVTLALRPLIGWPAPALNPRFQPLFPRYLWGQGTWNCFPSHSTLAYFTVTAGFWSLNRRLSAVLSVLALVVVSLPRVYLGGHYPVDVLFSCALSICMLVAISRWLIPPAVTQWLVRRGPGTAIRDCLLFLWVFELGEGFRGTEFLAAALRRLLIAL
jgi:membrane-associated phospholipid phosphatase